VTDERVPERFRDDVVARIGHGGEATVYELTGERVLRLYHRGHVHQDLGAIARFYDEIRRDGLGFALPQVLDHGEVDGVGYSVDRKLPGRVMIDVLPELTGAPRRRMLDSYMRCVEQIRELPLPAHFGGDFGEFFEDHALRADSWPAYLHASIDRQMAHMGTELRKDIAELDEALVALHARIDALPVVDRPSLVHGDYFPGNVLVDDELQVSAVLDFGPLTVAGDPMLDVASAAVFLEVQRKFDPGDSVYVMGPLIDRYGPGFGGVVATYRAWYGVRLGHSKFDDERLYAWCVGAVRGLLNA
jgi:aminoglycoside phosphotransferase (APT) family kinase protein